MIHKYSIRTTNDALNKFIRERAQMNNQSINGYILQLLEWHHMITEASKNIKLSPEAEKEMAEWRKKQPKESELFAEYKKSIKQ